VTSVSKENLAIAKMTARCAQHVSALKIVCKRKISRRLRKNRHITFCHYSLVKLFSKCSNQCDRVAKRYRRTDGQTDRRYRRPILWHHRAVKLGRQNVADIIGIADI